MKNFSARQLAFDYTTAIGSEISDVSPENNSGAIENTVRFPDFIRHDPAMAAAAKIAGRLNAAHISDQELSDFLRERTHLIDKKLDGTITKRESNRLEYVLWTLDRIEDARAGQVLEALEGYADQYETFLQDLDTLGHQLNSNLPRKRTKKNRR